MTPELLQEYFKLVGYAPDTVGRLRRFILDLAVRGLLVPQLAEDESASQLLSWIREKRELITEGRRSKKEAYVGCDEVPFEVPRGWVWTRLDEVTSYIQRGKSPTYASGTGLPVVSQKCVRWWGIDITHAKLIEPSSLASYEATRFLQDGDLLWNSTGTGTIGRVARVAGSPSSLVCDSHVTVVRCLGVSPAYIQAWLRSDHVFGSIEARAAGSTNQVELTASMARNQVVPLPPRGEQDRIVSKLDELMSLCDKLEVADESRTVGLAEYVASSLYRLAPDVDDREANEPSALRHQAESILGNISLLTENAQAVAGFGATVLDLGVRGLLTDREPEDTPVEDLIGSCERERTRLAAEGVAVARRSSKTSAQAPTWSVPKGWATATVGDLLVELRTGPFGSSLHKSDYTAGGTPVVNPQSLQNGRIIPIDGMAVGDDVLARLASFKLRKGDIVMARRGEMGRCAVVTAAEDGWLCGTGSLILRFAARIDRRFAAMLISSVASRRYLSRSSVGATMQNLNQAILLNMPVGLPPEEEQARIVVRVGQLLRLFEQLEEEVSGLPAARATFLDSLLAQAVLEWSHANSAE